MRCNIVGLYHASIIHAVVHRAPWVAYSKGSIRVQTDGHEKNILYFLLRNSILQHTVWRTRWHEDLNPARSRIRGLMANGAAVVHDKTRNRETRVEATRVSSQRSMGFDSRLKDAAQFCGQDPG